VTFAGCFVIRFSQNSLIAACGAFTTFCGASVVLPFVEEAMVAFSVDDLTDGEVVSYLRTYVYQSRR
jgi:hypothetical protein